jgi:hypothetical protein
MDNRGPTSRLPRRDSHGDESPFQIGWSIAAVPPPYLVLSALTVLTALFLLVTADLIERLDDELGN